MILFKLMFAVIGLTGLAGVASVAYGAAPDMREGLWEITSKTDMPGMPMNMPPQTMQRCFTQKDFSEPQKMAPADPSGAKCETSDYRMQGNTATWKMACKGQNPMTGTGSVTYTGSGYSGVNKMVMRHGSETMNMTINHSGKYLGPCKK